MKPFHKNSNNRKRRFHLHYLKGVLPFLAIIINLCFWIGPLTILALLRIILPFSLPRSSVYQMMTWIYYLAAWFDGILLFRIMGIHLEVTGIEQNYSGKFYLIIANHQAWSDILIMQHLFNLKAPVVKFLAKREMIFIPLVGLICWAYDFPFLQRSSFKSSQNRNTHNDIRSLSLALTKFMRSSASIMNFVEGTRFSAAKSKRQNSPYKHLLKPKTSGLYTIFQTLGDQLDAIIDITIVYDSPRHDFWDFLCGRCKRIKIKADTITLKSASASDFSLSSLPDFETVAEWINKIWEKKDNEIEMIKKSLQNQTSS